MFVAKTMHPSTINTKSSSIIPRHKTKIFKAGQKLFKGSNKVIQKRFSKILKALPTIMPPKMPPENMSILFLRTVRPCLL